VLQIFPVESSWEEGPGRSSDVEVMYEGVTWKSRSGLNEAWDTSGGDFLRTIESIEGETDDLVCEFEFSKRTSDVSLNITKIVEKWIDGTIENNGILVKFKNESITSQGRVSFFSKDTNTIYSPYIRIGYNDYHFDPCECISVEKLECLYETPTEQTNETWANLPSGSACIISGSAGIVSGSSCVITQDWSGLPSGSECIISGSVGFVSGSNCIVSGSITPPTEATSDCNPTLTRTTSLSKSKINHITDEDLLINLKGMRNKFSVKETIRVKIGVRERYPPKTFSPKSDYSQNNYVDYPLYYSVRDADTHEIRIPVDKYSRINCDANGHYFDFDFGCLSVGRIYEFLIRMETPVQTKIYDKGIKFMVTA
jgi:hypothetical protein